MAGRPAKKKSERRTNVLRIRLTESERRALDGAAAVAALDVSAWGRMILLGTAKNGTQETARPAVRPGGRAEG